MRKDNCIIYRGAMWMYYQILLTKIPENVQQLEGETTNQILLVTGLMKGKKGILHQRPRQQLASQYPFFFSCHGGGGGEGGESLVYTPHSELHLGYHRQGYTTT